MTKYQEQLVLDHMYLPKTIVSRMLGAMPTGIDVHALIGAANLGLIKAALKFDHTKKVRFNAYATIRIRGEVKDEVRRNDWIPRNERKKIQDNDNDNELPRVFSYDSWVSTINDPDPQENRTAHDRIEDLKAQCPSERLQRRELVFKAYQSMRPSERHVVILYYEHHMTMSQIARIIQRSEATVHNMIHEALRRAKKMVA